MIYCLTFKAVVDSSYFETPHQQHQLFTHTEVIMKRYLIALVALVIFSIPSLSAAAAGRPGPYLSVFLGANVARDATVSSFDGTTYSDRVTFDPGIYIGGTGGYDFGFLRLEGELSYRHANIDTITETEPTSNRFRNVEGDLGAFTTMFNVFLDMHNPSRVTPYLGGGIGFASLYLSDTTGYDTNLASRVPLYNESNDTVFAYQVGAGMDIAINNHFSLDIGYRYFITEKANFDADSISSNLRLESHNAKIGFNFKF
jgi:opacity protein-like surface antigen